MPAFTVKVEVPASLPALIMALYRDGAFEIEKDEVKGKISKVNFGDIESSFKSVAKKTAAGDATKVAFYDNLISQVFVEINEILKGGVLPMMT